MTPLSVYGDNSFQDVAVKALNTICPCSMFALAGGLSIEGDQEVLIVRNSTRDCACYCKHRAGCNLVQRLIDNSQPTVIHESEGGNDYMPDKDEVWWNPTGPPLPAAWYEGAGGGGAAETAMRLAHELVHALRDGNGTYVDDDGDKEECAAVRGANQIRKEQGLPLRKMYSENQAVDGYDLGIKDLLPWDLQGCSCGCKDMMVTFVRSLVLGILRLAHPCRLIDTGGAQRKDQ